LNRRNQKSNGFKTNPAKINKRRLWWLWVLGGLFLVLLGFGLFTFFRVNSFIDSAFSGRNEPSLLITEQLTGISPVAIGTAGLVSPTPVASATPSPPVTTLTPSPVTTIAVIEPVPTPTVPPATLKTELPANATLLQKIKAKERFTFLLAGYGGENHDGAYLTDMIMLLVFNPATNRVDLVNIPRDLYIYLPLWGPNKGIWTKINAAFAYVMNAPNSDNFDPRYRFDPRNPQSKVDAGINLLKDLVEQVTGVRIDQWATLTFVGYKQFINSLGGIEINVETAFDDYNYPAHDDSRLPYAVKHIHFDAGWQKLDGERALQFVRSRQSLQDGSDFGRSLRQMKMISALKDKLTKPETLLRSFSLMDALQQNVRTSLSLSELRELYELFKSETTAAGAVTFESHIINTDNLIVGGWSPEGSSILLPKAGRGNYSEIQSWIRKAIF
jgi:LCP family protein required for cell wall assembly